MLMGAAGGLLSSEVRYGRLQAHLLWWLAKDVDHGVESGPSPSIRFPEHGPFDVRLGYSRVPEIVERLSRDGAVVEAQAKWSSRLQQIASLGMFAPYHEKSRAGLEILGTRNESLYAVRWPQYVFDEFETIPVAVARTLLMIENRELLREEPHHLNPVVEWPRMAYALSQAGLRVFDPDRKVPGASTLATQMEKYRHSRGGLTLSSVEKLRQMGSAAVRTFLDGPDTREARQRILWSYLNTVPLAARAGFGEVHGLGDGLWAWFGTTLEEVEERLAGSEWVQADDPDLSERGRIYKQVLALLLSQRRPAHYLQDRPDQLEKLANAHLLLMAQAGIISTALRDAALAATLHVLARAPAFEGPQVADRKGADAIRLQLLERLGLTSLYDLDRLDLTVYTSVDPTIQRDVSGYLSSLASPEGAAAAGLVAHRLLAKGDPAQVRYSFALYERVGSHNLLRVHTDTHAGHFSLNDDMKLELGSTAKLRTLVTYLELVAEIYHRYAAYAPEALDALELDHRDRLARWVIRWRQARPGHTLQDILQAAMERRYSANPKERFVTGGGVHRFSNFNRRYDHTWPTVSEAFHKSINLPFIRMMRDIVLHMVFREPNEAASILARGDHERRAEYIERFADREGRQFLDRFYRRYRGLSGEAALEKLARRARPRPERLAVIYRSARPDATPKAMAEFVRRHLARAPVEEPGRRVKIPSEEGMVELYAKFAPGTFNLHDRGYIARIHPLELWTVAWFQHTQAPRSHDALQRASAGERQEVYGWLRSTSRRAAQNRRIRAMMEVDAYVEIHARWRRVGYPFERLVPSYATALGSSGDRPTALAELMGIISADGMRYPLARIERFEFAVGTPYETLVRAEPVGGARALDPSVATTVRTALSGVVAGGTGSRINGMFAELGLAIGAKTGTGDNRRRHTDARGRASGDEVLNRTGTLIFYMGDRWFGALTAHVAGSQAAEFNFTSALPAQVLKSMAPILKPLMMAPPVEPLPKPTPVVDRSS